MTNRPKAIGTAAETAVVRYLAAHGFPAAVCHVRGLPHLVLLLDRAATEIRQQEGRTNHD